MRIFLSKDYLKFICHGTIHHFIYSTHFCWSYKYIVYSNFPVSELFIILLNCFNVIQQIAFHCTFFFLAHNSIESNVSAEMPFFFFLTFWIIGYSTQCSLRPYTEHSLKTSLYSLSSVYNYLIKAFQGKNQGNHCGIHLLLYCNVLLQQTWTFFFQIACIFPSSVL